MTNRLPRPAPSAALAELLSRDGELDRILDGAGPTYGPPAPGPGITYGPPVRFEKPDWDAEHREFVERERQARIAEPDRGLGEEVPAAYPPPQRLPS